MTHTRTRHALWSGVLMLAMAAIGCGDSPVAVFQPAIRSVTPRFGQFDRATKITVTGGIFRAGATMTIGGIGVPVKFVRWDQLTAEAPPHDLGAVDIVVTNPDGEIGRLMGGFVYTVAPGPILSSVTPNTGFTDQTTEITVRGTGFQEGATVTFGEEVVATIFVDSTEIHALAPPQHAGGVDVIVTNLDTQSTQPLAAFTYVLPPPPVLTSLSPDSGPTSGGTEIQIVGTNLQVGLTVTVDGFALPARLEGSTALHVTTWPHNAGKVNVVVINPSGAASNALTFTFETSMGDPLRLR